MAKISLWKTTSYSYWLCLKNLHIGTKEFVGYIFSILTMQQGRIQQKKYIRHMRWTAQTASANIYTTKHGALENPLCMLLYPDSEVISHD